MKKPLVQSLATRTFSLCMLVLAAPLQAQTPPRPLQQVDFSGFKSEGRFATNLELGATNEGTIPLTPSGGGVTGRPGDYAFDNRSATAMGSEGTGAVVNTAEPPSPFPTDMMSMTWSGWFRAVGQPLGNSARLIQRIGGTQGFMLFGGKPGRLAIQLNGHSSGTNTTVVSGDHYTRVDEWVFFAVTYDGSLLTDNVRFYVGSQTTPVRLVDTRTLALGPVRTNTGPTYFGNSESGSRPFKGLLDDVRIFGSEHTSAAALPPVQLEALRQEGVATKAAPAQ